ncbi:cation-translocating P-type ATPase [Spiroplasma taiwanense]|uniref:Cation-transporting ATPase n=1 Tax=Spiroplasma taiwanense CT-1 TaxID=1276220 RepID=S5LTY7_9MOLU|nr:cation-translocating P-type ATPase [Spiroplasma taiwanense]AGR41174.1 cation-transporting ATPase [Spiroplasma taiwanense CT-1]
MDEHLSSNIQKLEELFETNIDKGLTSEQVEEKLKKFGKNKLPQGKITPWYIIFLKTLIEPIVLVLMAAAVISIIAPIIDKAASGAKIEVSIEEFIDAIVIFSIVLIDAILETVQTLKARKSMDALKSLSKPKAVVIRNDSQQEIDASQLVPGDIVVLEAGKYVPAELRIVQASDLTIDESLLTGESLPVEKIADPLMETTTILAEMKNIAFMSTFTTNGRAIGIVIKTGKFTEIGKIAESINENDEQETPLEKKLHSFTYWISALSFGLAVLIFTTLFLSGSQAAWSNYLMIAITLAIGVIPECLAAVVSITLSISTKKMVKQHVIIKKLQAVETLGSVNIICTDKTGTLTQNRMTVKRMIMDNKILESKIYAKEANDNHMDLFLKSLVLCNDSVTEGTERIGDPTELALVDYAEIIGYDEQDARDTWKRIDEIPFDSERKMMTTVNSINGINTTFTKGAIDQLLKKCTKIMIDNVEREITQEDIKQILQISEELSSNALRVLGFAFNNNYDNEKDKDHLEHDLVFLGAVGMIDPVRETAVNAVKQAHNAGIKVVMITGDHASTALAIAKDLDLAYSTSEVMSSVVLNKMSDDELLKIIEQIKVFARVNPEHKVRIVDALQKNGNIVSMTGDGVNDAPSLSKANIGVAMGITGTDVAKQASDVILTDDNFETIIRGVNEGRNVYQKIKRAIAFVIGVNLANVLSIFILSAINTVSPLEATNILWMNLIVESIVALSIGMGSNDDTLMKIKPIKGKNSLFKGLNYTFAKIIIFTSMTSIAGFYFGMSFISEQEVLSLTNNTHTTWFAAFRDANININNKIELGDHGRTAMFIVITCAPCFYANFIKLSNWKSDKKIKLVINKPLWIASIAAVMLNLIAVFIPVLNNDVLDLISSNSYNNTNWYLVPCALLISLIPTILMLLLDFVTFSTYHYLPDPWRRNRLITQEMVEKDNIAKIQKNRKSKKPID